MTAVAPTTLPPPPPTGIRAYSAVPQTIAKEWVSVAYVQAIAAQIGLNLKAARWDNGIDLELGSLHPVATDFQWQNLWICLQLKATANWEIRDGQISFFLEQKNYDCLRQRSISRQFLVLYTMNGDGARSMWLRHHAEYTQLAGRAYYLDLLNAPPLAPRANGRSRTGRTIRIPVANRLTAASLRGLYEESATWTKERLGL